MLQLHRIRGFATVICLMGLVSACATTPPIYRNSLSASTASAGEISKAKKGAGNQMIDPGAVEFRGIAGYRHNGSIVLCGEINGKNRFGGYVGYSHFVYAGGVLLINKLEGKGEFWENSFNSNWNVNCQ